MKNGALAVVALVCAAICVWADGSPVVTPGAVSSTPVAGRFTIDMDSWELPMMLDTATGDTWVLRDSSNLADIREVAWTPMTRLTSETDVQRWLNHAHTTQDRYLAGMKARSLANFESKKQELGPDHPDVRKLEREIRQFPLFQGVTPELLEQVQQEQYESDTESP